jgi:hypothetical protein
MISTLRGRVETFEDPWKACFGQAKRQGCCRVFRAGVGLEVEKRLMLIETRRCLVLRHASWRIVRAVSCQPQQQLSTTQQGPQRLLISKFPVVLLNYLT